jgi:hypothetical protein
LRQPVKTNVIETAHQGSPLIYPSSGADGKSPKTAKLRLSPGDRLPQRVKKGEIAVGPTHKRTPLSSNFRTTPRNTRVSERVRRHRPLRPPPRARAAGPPLRQAHRRPLPHESTRHRSDGQAQREEAPDPDVHRAGVGRLVHQRDQALHDAVGGAEDRVRLRTQRLRGRLDDGGDIDPRSSARVGAVFLTLTHRSPLGLSLLSVSLSSLCGSISLAEISVVFCCGFWCYDMGESIAIIN